MSFMDLSLKEEYRSFSDDILDEFYIPVLNESVMYQRAVGFFSSTALLDISLGLIGLLKNDGKIKLVVSPRLSPEDVKAIEEGLSNSDEIIIERLLESITKPETTAEQKRYDLLVNLLASKRMEIKIAVVEKRKAIGIYHEKLGLMYDRDENVIAFTGSMNETDMAFKHNFESIDVFRSWGDERSRVESKINSFKAIWDDYAPSIRTMEFPEAVKEKMISYQENSSITINDFSEDSEEFMEHDEVTNVPSLPQNIELRDYQIEAISNWENAGFKGIFDMATGTGKTITGLAAATKLFETNRNRLGIIIVCPYQHLVEQWVEDIRLFGLKPIICYSSSNQKNWKQRLKRNIRDFKFGITKCFCAIFTNATFALDYIQEEIKKINKNCLILIDEAHNFGAVNYSMKLPDNIPYRLALSATIARHGDEEGTDKLFKYFGEKCIEYTLRDAIRNGMLTPYEYYPIPINLDEIEREDYLKLTKEIVKCGGLDEQGKISDYAKMLLIKRSRIVAAANDKVVRLKELMKDYKTDNHILVYCGATTIRDPSYQEGNPEEEEVRQIDYVTRMLGNELGMDVAQFTSKENNANRMILKKEFDKGESLQALVAIRCLDEGVNIPSIKYAFILSSSTNPKEYIQRRGRVLRKYPGKDKAIIFDFITDPIPDAEFDNVTSDAINSMKSLVKKEIFRMRDFADISENPASVDRLVQSLCEKYDVNIYEEEDDDEF
ncbi:DEAD/DEAH box helicase family protein [Lacrimispora saccharolytica]|uniref:DEAD/DEAH box helicase family protein n=1 Tax=Lacrimispora saccharolytica TaxID=84030 RepID=UPI00265D246F|nr:DEAD/DEAH box helicase family protein [Lacrimispora saccharolytica]MCF2657512.1 DEAD/DEAH box helicase family protein [Lacrimispora saccharolytica]